MSYSRFAIYFVPPKGPLADFGAAWLGWDITSGVEATQLDVKGLRDITMTPKKYGFHGTLKPPFRLADGFSQDQLELAITALAGSLEPATCASLVPNTLGQFLALTPKGDVSGLSRIAEVCVCELDRFRAPAVPTELVRRRKAGLSAEQDILLTRWGYPYVLEEFRFHMTLSEYLPKQDLVHWLKVVGAYLPDLPKSVIFDQIALCGERVDGRFELIHRYALTG